MKAAWILGNSRMMCGKGGLPVAAGGWAGGARGVRNLSRLQESVRQDSRCARRWGIRGVPRPAALAFPTDGWTRSHVASVGRAAAKSPIRLTNSSHVGRPQFLRHAANGPISRSEQAVLRSIVTCSGHIDRGVQAVLANLRRSPPTRPNACPYAHRSHRTREQHPLVIWSTARRGVGELTCVSRHPAFSAAASWTAALSGQSRSGFEDSRQINSEERLPSRGKRKLQPIRSALIVSL